MQALTENQIQEALAALPGWRFDGYKLLQQWQFADFLEAMRFVNRVAPLAEAAGHHPDIDIRYNRVTLGLVTHDAGGITARDTAMAAQLTRELPN